MIMAFSVHESHWQRILTAMRASITIICTTALVALVALAGCGSGIDEQAWRHDTQQAIGEPLSNHRWTAIRHSITDACGYDKTPFAKFVAVTVDDQAPGYRVDPVPEQVLQVGVRYACPDRSHELDGALRLAEIGSD